MHHENYVGLALIGSGGFADVYRATYVPSARQVALKVSRAGGEAPARIRREIEVQLGLRHANIVPILDYDRDSFSWFAMEIAEGSVGDVVRKGPLSELDTVRLLEEILGALGVAHRRDLVHRDISPGNILRMGGRWCLADWGYVSEGPVNPVDRITRTGTAGGTFAFAAPETLLDAHRVTPSSDLFALGKLVAWAMNPDIPLEHGKSPELGHTGEWARFLEKMTCDDIDERFQSAEEALQGMPRSAVRRVSPAPETSGPAAEERSGSEAADVGAIIRDALLQSRPSVRVERTLEKMMQDVARELGGEKFSFQTVPNAQVVEERLRAYANVVAPLAAAMFWACRDGDSDCAQVVRRVMERLVRATKRSGGGYTLLSRMHSVPVALVMSAGALGAELGENPATLASCTVLPVVLRDDGEEEPIVRYHTICSVTDRDAMRSIEKYSKLRVPGSEFLGEFLGQVTPGVWAGDEDWERVFQRTEVILAVLAFMKDGWSAGRYVWKEDAWSGRSGTGPVGRIVKELEGNGLPWEFAGELNPKTDLAPLRRAVETVQQQCRER